MEKLSTLAARDEYDLIVVDTPPSRSALDFLDAPQRLSSFLDGRMIRLLAAPSRGVMRVVGAGFTLFTKAVTHDARRPDAARTPPSSCSSSRTCSAASGSARRPPTNCSANPAPRSSWSSIPRGRLAAGGLVLRRPAARRTDAAGRAGAEPDPPAAGRAAPRASPRWARPPWSKSAPLTAAVLRIHAERLAVRAAEVHMRGRFDRAHPGLPVLEVPALPSDAHDVPALREIGRRLTDRRDVARPRSAGGVRDAVHRTDLQGAHHGRIVRMRHAGNQCAHRRRARPVELIIASTLVAVRAIGGLGRLVLGTLLAGVLVAGLLLPYSIGFGLASNEVTTAIQDAQADPLDGDVPLRTTSPTPPAPRSPRSTSRTGCTSRCPRSPTTCRPRSSRWRTAGSTSIRASTGAAPSARCCATPRAPAAPRRADRPSPSST